MNDDVEPDDIPSLEALRRSLGTEMPPPGMDDRSESLLGWLDIDDQLGHLLSDVAAEPVGVRGAPSATSAELSSTSEGEPVVEWRVDGDVVSGQVMSDSVNAVDVQFPDGAMRSADLSEFGRFNFDGVPPGPARLRLSHTDGRTMLTSWFVV